MQSKINIIHIFKDPMSEDKKNYSYQTKINAIVKYLKIKKKNPAITKTEFSLKHLGIENPRNFQRWV